MQMPRVLSTVLLTALALGAWTEQAFTQSDPQIGLLVESVGQVSVNRSGNTVSPGVGDDLFEGDTVSTGESGKARILLKDNSVLLMGPETIMDLNAVDLGRDRNLSLRARVGSFLVQVADWLGGGSSNSIFATPTATAAVRGTTVWGNTELDAICALAGTVSVTPRAGADNTVTISAGQCVQNMATGTAEPLQPSREQLEAFLDEVTIP